MSDGQRDHEGCWLLFVLGPVIALAVWGLLRPQEAGPAGVASGPGAPARAVAMARPTLAPALVLPEPATAPTPTPRPTSTSLPTSTLPPAASPAPAVDPTVAATVAGPTEDPDTGAAGPAGPEDEGEVATAPSPWAVLGWLLVGLAPAAALIGGALCIYRHIALTRARVAALRAGGMAVPPPAVEERPVLRPAGGEEDGGADGGRPVALEEYLAGRGGGHDDLTDQPGAD